MRWLVLSLVLAGCGYRFVAPGGALPEGLRAVFAPVFQNRTAEAGAEVFFTQAFRDQLQRAGTLADSTTEARVEGVLLGVGGAPFLASPGKLPAYRLTATVSLTLSRNGRALSSTQVTGSEEYPAGADLLLTEANRQAALRRLAESTMREGYERLASGM